MTENDEPIRQESIEAGDPRYDGFRIHQLYAYVHVDPDDNQEGVVAFLGRDGMWMPMVAADERRARSLAPVARRLAKEGGRPIQFVKFSVREDLEVIEP